MKVEIVEGEGGFGGKLGASHCNQWGLCDALFSNYFEDLLTIGSRLVMALSLLYAVAVITNLQQQLSNTSEYSDAVISVTVSHLRCPSYDTAY